MELKDLLTSVPVEQWQTRQAIMFDWYDGPREGVCALTKPGGEFWFQLLDERPTTDHLDDRLFALKELPNGSVHEILGLLHDLGEPTGPEWIPLWRFPGEPAQRQAEEQLQKIEASARPAPLVISTRDMIHFLGCWTVDPSDRAVGDWFAALGIS